MPKYRSKEWLSSQYPLHSVRDIAKNCQVSESTIRRWLHKHGIKLIKVKQVNEKGVPRVKKSNSREPIPNNGDFTNIKQQITVKVYIAGPYSKGNMATNVAKAMAAWHKLADLGFAPFCPHLTHFLDMQKERPYEEWLEQDLVWLKECNAVFRLPGESNGADLEVDEADRLGIPIFYHIEMLAATFKPIDLIYHDAKTGRTLTSSLFTGH